MSENIPALLEQADGFLEDGDTFGIFALVKGLVLALRDKEADLQRAREEQEQWREMLWLNHGCENRMLYGDDGEMQCSRCGLDFKRMPPEDIKAAWLKRYLASRHGGTAG